MFRERNAKRCRVATPLQRLLLTAMVSLCGQPFTAAESAQSATDLVPDDAPEGLSISKPHVLSEEFPVGGRFMRVTNHGSLELKNTELGEFGAEGLSALAFDADENVLYALSDFGALLHLLPGFDNGTMVDVTLLGTYGLKDAGGQPLDSDSDDAEGLALENANDGIPGNTRVLVSFEGDTRVSAYSPLGDYLSALPLPAALADPARFPERNQGLEALALLPEMGLVSGPQRPFKDTDTSKLHLYASEGQHWTFTPIDPEHSSLVALEALPDGRLVLLERRYISFFQSVLFAVRLVDPLKAPGGGELPVTDLVVFDSSKGWRIDNFEGIARHAGNRFFVVSDDNANPIQKTLLLYLELDLN